jgi:hypothetical protein
MNLNQTTRVILGSLRYQSAPNTDIGLSVPMTQTSKEVFEFDRTVDVSLAQVYDDERQSSQIFRPVSKFTLIVKNTISGQTGYSPFKNNLYYTDAVNDANSQCTTPGVNWRGLPQYNEFDFIRTDYGVTGYTYPPNNHINFVAESASTYNWSFYVTIPYENDYTKNLEAQDKYGNTFSWVAGDGIPFVIYGNTTGSKTISLYTPMKHNISVNEYVKLNFTYDGNDTFQVYSLGNGTYDSEQYVINISNVGFTGSTFNNGNKGTLKRLLNTNNGNDVLSKYYVRKHKVISKTQNNVLVKSGFEETAFDIVKKYQSGALTPNKVARIATKENVQAYTLSFNEDYDLTGVNDNNNLPVSSLYFTVIWKGYFGWTMGTPQNGTDGPGLGTPNFNGLKQGWEFNLQPQSNGEPQPWWTVTHANSNTNFNIASYNSLQNYTKNGLPVKFTYVQELKTGDTMDGAFCEYNPYEIYEYTLSELYHKFRFNPFVFKVQSISSVNPNGYYYKPYYEMKIRVFSDYIEEGKKENIAGIPDYSTYSTTTNSFRWRDLYPYGFKDENNRGVDYPFINGKHHPFVYNIFRLIPEGSTYSVEAINDPTIDKCE